MDEISKETINKEIGKRLNLLRTNENFHKRLLEKKFSYHKTRFLYWKKEKEY